MRHSLAERPIAAHARAVPGGWSGNAVRPLAVPGTCSAVSSTVNLANRSSCRSGSGYGRRRTETAGLIGSRGAQTGRRHVDERHDCRDIGPAYVSSTMWGTASMCDRQVGLGAVLAPQGRNATPPLLAASGRARPAAPHPPDDTSSPVQQSRTYRSVSASRWPLSPHQFRHSAPDMRGAAQPSTETGLVL